MMRLSVYQRHTTKENNKYQGEEDEYTEKYYKNIQVECNKNAITKQLSSYCYGLL